MFTPRLQARHATAGWVRRKRKSPIWRWFVASDGAARRTAPPGAQRRQPSANVPHVAACVLTPVGGPPCMLAHAYRRAGPSFEFRWGHHAVAASDASSGTILEPVTPAKVAGFALGSSCLRSHPEWTRTRNPQRWASVRSQQKVTTRCGSHVRRRDRSQSPVILVVLPSGRQPRPRRPPRLAPRTVSRRSHRPSPPSCVRRRPKTRATGAAARRRG